MNEDHPIDGGIRQGEPPYRPAAQGDAIAPRPIFSAGSLAVAIVSFLVVLLIILCLGVSINESITDTRIDRLFARDGRVTVSRFIVLGHQRDGHWPLVVDDVESAQYLTAAFQHSCYLGYVPHRNYGSTYSFRVESAEGERDRP